MMIQLYHKSIGLVLILSLWIPILNVSCDRTSDNQTNEKEVKKNVDVTTKKTEEKRKKVIEKKVPIKQVLKKGILPKADRTFYLIPERILVGSKISKFCYRVLADSIFKDSLRFEKIQVERLNEYEKPYIEEHIQLSIFKPSTHKQYDFLINAQWLKEGRVEVAKIDYVLDKELSSKIDRTYNPNKAVIDFKGKKYEIAQKLINPDKDSLYWEGHAWYIHDGEEERLLYKSDYTPYENKISIEWAGDLNKDGNLDIYMLLDSFYGETVMGLFLSGSDSLTFTFNTAAKNIDDDFYL